MGIGYSKNDEAGQYCYPPGSMIFLPVISHAVQTVLLCDESIVNALTL